MSRLTYTEQELQQINELVWIDPPASEQKSTSVPCPSCGADTFVLISWSGPGCGATVLIINCDGCGRTGRRKPVEERCSDIDEEQMQAIVKHHLRGQQVFYPTCRTELHVMEDHTLGELHYSGYCYRGGGMGQLGFPR